MYVCGHIWTKMNIYNSLTIHIHKYIHTYIHTFRTISKLKLIRMVGFKKLAKIPQKTVLSFPSPVLLWHHSQSVPCFRPYHDLGVVQIPSMYTLRDVKWIWSTTATNMYKDRTNETHTVRVFSKDSSRRSTINSHKKVSIRNSSRKNSWIVLWGPRWCRIIRFQRLELA